MVALAVIALVSFTSTHAFNVTDLTVPEIVSPDQETVEIECRYEGNFTVFMWFKDRKEFFRYLPGVTPDTHTFPLEGVRSIEILACGPVSCRLKLFISTGEATGMYKCDIERQIYPYKFASKVAYMNVLAPKHKKPVVVGLAQEFGEGDEIQATCYVTSVPDSDIRWYINGQEEEKMRGLLTLSVKSARHLFLGVPPTVSVHCTTFRYGTLLMSEVVKAQWRQSFGEICAETAKQQRNRSNILVDCIFLVCVLCFTSIKMYKIFFRH